MASSKKAPFFHQYLAVDFGTDSMKLYRSGKGLLPTAPSMVLLHRHSGEPLAMEDSHSPSYALHPLGERGIVHYDLALLLLQRAMKQAGFSRLRKVHVLMAVPCHLGDGEAKLLHELALDAGAKGLSLIPSPLAGYYGALEAEHDLQMVLDMGDSFTSLALISHGEILKETSFVLGGRDFSHGIMHYVRKEYHCLFSEASAKLVKESIATLSPVEGRESASICGMCLQSGLPKNLQLTAQELMPCLQGIATILCDRLAQFLTELSPLHLAQLRRQGILVLGGASLLTGLWDYVSKDLGFAFHIAKHPQTAVIEGLGYLCDEGKVEMQKRRKEDFSQRKTASF